MKPSTEDPRIERTRQVVLEAAAALVGECGFGRTTIEAVAERSGVARSTIYRHWPQRPDLLVEAITSHIGDIPHPDSGNLRTDLLTMYRALGEWLSDPKLGAMVSSLVAEAKRDPRLAEIHAAMTQGRRHRIEEMIERAIQRGEIPDSVDARQMANDLSAPMFYRAFVTHEPLDETFVEAHIERFMHIHTGTD